MHLLENTLGGRPMPFAPPLVLPAGWDVEVLAETQAAISSLDGSHMPRMTDTGSLTLGSTTSVLH